MKAAVYLVVDACGVRRMTKRTPTLERGEVAFRLAVAVPDHVFRPAFLPAVTVDVPAAALDLAGVTADVIDPPAGNADG